MGKQLMILSGELLDDEMRVSLTELCKMCGVDADQIRQMVEEGVVEPHGSYPQEWRFSGAVVKRIQVAIRLQRDLRINLPGVALALELLDELEELRQQLHHRQR